MKIVTIVRTLNEERNIERFLKQYSFSDVIIISDGGSKDQTYKIASRLAKKYKFNPTIQWNDFSDRIPASNSAGFFTNEPKQINDLINQAKKFDPDWIIYDDCDCWPNSKLKLSARKLLEGLKSNHYYRVLINRLYVYKGKWYFPELNKPGKSLWAWNPNKCSVHCKEDDPKEPDMVQDTTVSTFELAPPYTLLHNFAQSEKHIQESLEWYKAKGQPKLHPKVGCGKLVKLPDYAHI